MNDISQFLMSHGGPVLFAIVFVEQAGLPLPSAPWLLAAGALSASGKLNPALAIGTTALAAILADSLWFYLGRRGGQRVLRFFCRLSLARNSCVGRTKGLFARHGLQALVVAKFLPGLGTVMPPLAGALGMKTSRFFLFDGLGSLIYGAFYIVAGFVFHDQLQQAMALMRQFGFSALLLVLVVVAGYVAFKYARRRNLLSQHTRHQTAESQKAEEAVEDPGILTAHPRHAVASLPQEYPRAVELPAVTLALSSEAAQGVDADTAVRFVARPCNL